MKEQISSNNRKIAMQHQQLAKNTLFAHGRPKLHACTHTWKGKTTIVSEETKGKRAITTKEECDYFIEAVSAYQMDAHDQLLFLIILYLMRIEQQRESVDTPESLEASGWLSKAQTLRLTTTLSELCKLMQIAPSGQNMNVIKARLKRLGHVSLVCEVNSSKCKRSWSSNLLSWHLVEEKDPGKPRALSVTLPAVLASAAHKQGAQIHSSHDIDELVKLSKDAILLHNALSSRIRPGKIQRLKFETLIEFMQFQETTPLKKQRHLTKKAIEDIAKMTGWKVTHEMKNEVYKFQRPELVDI